MSTRSLNGRIALVTGASRGIGRTIAQRLVEAGAVVALVARDPEPLSRTASELGASARAYPFDVSSSHAVRDLAELVRHEIGPPTILVNAAGAFGPISTIAETDAEEWIATLGVNLVGPFLTCRAFSPAMVDAGWGRILNVTSAASLHTPGPLNSAYATSKVALNQFTRHLAAELEGSGVSANVFHPGDVKTAMWGDIRARANALGPLGAAYREWVDWVEATGGDPPEKAADVVLEHAVSEQPVSGRFLWIKEPLQPPIPAWDDAAPGDRPWAG